MIWTRGAQYYLCMLKEHSRAFVAFLKLNRNVSPNTIRAYDTDVMQFLELSLIHI